MGSAGLEKSGYLASSQGTLFRTEAGQTHVKVIVQLWCTGAGPETIEFWENTLAFSTVRKVAQLVLDSSYPQAELEFSSFRPTDTLLAATTNATTVEYTIHVVTQNVGQI